MTKQEMIHLVQHCGADSMLKDMVVGFINTAWEGGIEEGMKKAARIQREVYEMMVKEADG